MSGYAHFVQELCDGKLKLGREFAYLRVVS